MKRAEQLAWTALAGLVAIVAILLTGGVLYHFTGFWAGMMMALGQGVSVALAAWGLMLARQAAELNDLPGLSREPGKPENSTGEFRMSLGDDAQNSPARNPSEGMEARTLDTGFQRLLVGISAFIMLVLGCVTAYLIYSAYRWAALNPDKTLPVAGTYLKPAFLDELGLVIGLAAAGIYGVLWWVTRVTRQTEGYGEAVSSGFTLGIGGMAALAVATVLGYLPVAYASELASGVIAALMVLQGLELLVNAMRSYSSIEELDQEAVDLQALPLVPMLGSAWLGALKMLFAQSVGLSGKEARESSVIARMMPRSLLAIVVIAILVSCIRVVQPGEVAVLERLGWAPYDEKTKTLDASAILQPGMHLTLPWPMDQLVRIPTESLQLTDVGTELHAPPEWKNVNFQFWTVRAAKSEDENNEDEFMTGDPGSPQMLETYVQVRWRVANPARFYAALSHSEFFEKSSAETKALPIYEAMVQQCTSYAVTQSFALHSLDQILLTQRPEVEEHTRQILQQKLDSLDSGIEAVYLTIKDLHPPYQAPDQLDPTQPMIGGQQKRRGPASAFEYVTSMSEFLQMQIKRAEAESNVRINTAQGDADSAINYAKAYKQNVIAQAQGEAGHLLRMTQNMPPAQEPFLLDLLKQQLMYKTLNGLYDPVTKVIVDPKVKDIEIFQTTDKGMVPVRPPG